MKPATAWSLYDVGHSAFATTMMAAVLPVWFATQIATGLDPDPERARVLATSRWADVARRNLQELLDARDRSDAPGS